MFQKCKFIEITFVYAGTLTSIPIEWEKKRRLENHQIFCNTNYMLHTEIFRKTLPLSNHLGEIDLSQNTQVVQMKGFDSV